MQVFLVLASMLMLVSMIEASSSLEPVRQKSGRVVWKNGKRFFRVWKFGTTTTVGTTTKSTITTEAPTTSTTSEPPPTNQNGTWDDIAENIEKNFDNSMGSSSSDNVIDLGEQDIENLDLTKLYDRDTSKDDPNGPTVLQFVASSSTYMDPAYISRIIQQQLGEGYEYTDYTITPSAITSDYSAPFPKTGFELPPPPMEKLNGPPPGFIEQEEHTIRPTKHEFPPIQSTHQSPSPPSSGSPSPAPPNGNYTLPTQEYNSPPVKSSSYSSAVRGQSGYNPQRIKGPSTTPRIYSSSSPAPPIYTSTNPPPEIYSSPSSNPLIYSSPSPPPIYSVPRPSVDYNSPSPAPAFSTKAPPTHYSGPPKGTYRSPTQSTYIIPKDYSTLSEQMVAPGLAPAIIGGYGVPEGQAEAIQPEKYSSTEIMGFPNGQGNLNEYSAPADDSDYTVQSDDSGPTIIVRHHHHYVNYIDTGTGTGGEQSNPSESFDASESVYLAQKYIFESLAESTGYSPHDDSVGPSIIYGKPAPQLSYRLPTTASSIVKFLEPSSDDSESQVAYQSPVGPQESYNPSSYRPPPNFLCCTHNIFKPFAKVLNHISNRLSPKR